MSRISLDVTASTFQAEVIDRSSGALVLVDFWAQWCGPCRQLKPLLEKLVAGYGGRVVLAKVDADREQALAARYQVRSIPSVKAFVAGRMVDEFSGALPESALRAFIDRWLPSPAMPLVERARALRATGEGGLAEATLREALALDAALEPATLELAELLIDRGAFDAARSLLDPLQFRARDEDRLRALQARLSIEGEQDGEHGEQALRQRVEARPDDLDARLELGRRLAGERRWDEALAMLLEIVRRDRAFGDDVGRRTMLDIFALMPAGEPALRGFRAKLAQTLNR